LIHGMEAPRKIELGMRTVRQVDIADADAVIGMRS